MEEILIKIPMEFIKQILVGTLTGGIVAFFTAIFATKVALKRFYAEKWWIRKEQAYAEIINALHDSIQFFKAHKDDYGQGTGLSDEKEVEIYQKYSQAYQRINKATDIASFYLPLEAEKILLELRNRERLNFHDNPKCDIYEEDFIYHQNALDKFLKIAKSDLKK